MSSEPIEELLKEEYSDEDWWVAHGYENPDDIPVPDWHIAILQERMARYEKEPVEWTPLEEFAKEIEEFRNSLEFKED